MNTVWIIEIEDAEGWFPLTVYLTRSEARKHVKERGDGRVRRFVYSP